MKTQKLLYLHGFNSSPQSHKAQLMQQYMREHQCEHALLCPQIPEIPQQAKPFLERLVEKTLMTHRLSFVGSSLGGYYATYLAEKYTGSAVLINPSIKPYVTLEKYLGENKFYYADKCWNFDETHIQQLKELDVENVTRLQRYLVLLQTGDETLDYREAVLKFGEDQCIVEQGGDHGFTDFECHISRIMKFCNISCD